MTHLCVTLWFTPAGQEKSFVISSWQNGQVQVILIVKLYIAKVKMVATEGRRIFHRTLEVVEMIGVVAKPRPPPRRTLGRGGRT